MEKIMKSILGCVVLLVTFSLTLKAQISEDKEVIIIEKIVDENGKIISKKIIRSSEGDLSDDEIDEELESATEYGKLKNFFNQKNFNFDDLGFFNSTLKPKPTLGVVLSFEDGGARITEIVNGSGAEEAELQVDDIIVSINGLVVNTIDDIKEYIKDKKEGDILLLSIIRVDQSFEKKIELKNNRFNSLFGNIDPEQFEGFQQLFNFGGGNNRFKMDSLFRNFDGQDKFPFEFGLPNYSEKEVEETKPSLGVFIDETDEGIVISEIMEHSAAERAKLKVNDRILKIDGNTVESFDDLARFIKAAGKNTRLMITYERSGKTREAEVILE